MNSPQVFAQYAQRRSAVADRVAHAGHDALLVTDLKNIRYLTGFSGSNAVLLLRSDASAVLATDGRYDTQIRLQTGEPKEIEIRVVADAFREVVAAADGYAVEPGLSIAQAHIIGNVSELPVLHNAVEDERLVKDASEIEALQAAGRLADTVWQQFLADGGIQRGMREIDAAADLENRLRRAGADSLSFDTILASGVNGAKPHAGVSTAEIVDGLVTVDFGVYLNGYASDQTRTVCVGEPDELSARIYDVVYRSQKAGEAVLAPGVALRDVDAACRTVIEEAGFGEFFVHSTGHGVGLDVHESPRAASTVSPDAVLKAGMTVTVEPGIYLPGKTGLRIENTYIITDDGAVSCQESPTELVVIK